MLETIGELVPAWPGAKMTFRRGGRSFTRMLRENVYDVLQPESMVLGGITTLRKIGTMADAFGKKCVPHHGGGDIGVIAHLHLVASWSHAPFMELLHDLPVGDYRNRFSIFKAAQSSNPTKLVTSSVVLLCETTSFAGKSSFG